MGRGASSIGEKAEGKSVPERNMFEDLLDQISVRSGDVMAATVAFSIAAAILVASFAAILYDVPLQTEKDVVYAIVKGMAYLSLIYVMFKALHRFIIDVVLKKESESDAANGEETAPAPARRRERRPKPEEKQRPTA